MPGTIITKSPIMIYLEKLREAQRAGVVNGLMFAGKAQITIPVGPVGTVGRKIYRTKAGGADYFLVGKIADNTTTSYLDSTVADADLGSPLPLVNLTSSRPQLNR